MLDPSLGAHFAFLFRLFGVSRIFGVSRFFGV
jgi:hypothetical protein